MRLFALRGATSVESNEADAILAATGELMRELMERNELEPGGDGELHLHRHRGPRRRVPGGRGAAARAGLGAAAVRPRGAGAGLAAAGDPSARALLRARGSRPAPRVPRRGARRCEPTSTRHNRHAVPIEFAERIRRIPVYPVAGGYDLGEDVAMLASNESCFAPLPAVVEAAQRVIAGANRYPDPVVLRAPRRARRTATASRPSGSRSATARATSCWPRARRCSSPAPRSCTRGRRSACIRTSRPPPGRARSRCRSTPRIATTSTRSLAEVTVATRLVLICNPNNPTSTAVGLERGGAVPGRACRPTCA